MSVSRLLVATCTGLSLALILSPMAAAGVSGEGTEAWAQNECKKLVRTDLGIVPAGFAERCGTPATRAVTESIAAASLLVNRGPILAQEVSTTPDQMNTTSVAGIATLTPFGALGLGTDFPADVVILPTDPVHAYQLSSTGLANRMDTAGTTVALPNNLPPAGENWTDMAVHPITGVVYASSSTCVAASSLSIVNLATGSSVLVGPITNSNCMVGIAFDSTGVLYGYDIANDSLMSINTATGAGTVIGPIGFDANYGQAMDCDPLSGVCYLFSFNNTVGAVRPELRSVNLATGATTFLGVIGLTVPGVNAQVAGAAFGTIRDCQNDPECGDGNQCNGIETCSNGVCAPGTPIDCNDNQICTLDVCDPPTGNCSHPPDPCNDNDPCTVDSCSAPGGCANQNICSRFCNTGTITIPALGVATPYPSTIGVSGVASVASLASLELLGISHNWPDDIDMLLVGPGGQNAIIMSDVGGSVVAAGVNLKLTDAAATSMPDAGPLVSGSFKPTNVDAVDTFAAPAPTPSGGSALSVFDGSNPNGNWQLYVLDDDAGISGSVSGGWCVNILVSVCTTNADCDDGNPCNGIETCNASNQCVPGTPIDCNDGLFCTLDLCNRANGECVHPVNPCEEGDLCTTDSCDEETDSCVHVYECGQYCNTGSITINDAATATPYPSTIGVSGLGASAVLGFVELLGLSHTYPDDIDMLLSGPAGQNAVILSDAGGGTDAVGVNLTLADSAIAAVPDGGPMVTGVFRPTNVDTADTFPAPAPATAGGSALAAFGGKDPNGNWQLYVVDDATTDLGSLSGGWCVNIRACAAAREVNTTLRVAKSGAAATILWTDAPGPFNVYRGLQTSGVPWTYNHTCLQSSVTGDSTSDATVPAPGAMYYYLVTRKSACGESIPGRDSSASPIPNASPCP